MVPAGSPVRGSFHTNDSDKVGFTILAQGRNPIYLTDSSNGSFNFTSPTAGVTFQVFLFGQVCTVYVSGHSTAPILWSPSFPIP